MKLSELLETARAEPPATRYTVDDIVAAGRRRKRRRNSGWAVLALLAVFAAVGVPQVVARLSGPPVDVELPAFPSGAKPFDLIFSGYLSGDLRVGDPDWVSVNNQTTYIGREVTGSRGRAYRSAGKLALYRPGFQLTRLWETSGITPTERIRGGEAFFAKPAAPEDSRTVNRADSMLVWEYAENALAVVTSYGGLSRPEMVRLATAFRLTEPRPARQAYAISWVPPGLRLVAVEAGRRGMPTSVFVPQAKSAGFTIDPRVDQMAVTTGSWSEPFRDSAGDMVDYSYPMAVETPGYASIPAGGAVIGIFLGRMAGSSRTPKCAPRVPGHEESGTECEAAPEGDGFLVARGSPALPLAQLKRMAGSGRITGADGKPGTWETTRESFPTSAQVRRG